MFYATLIEIAITAGLTWWSFRMKSAKRWVFAGILLLSLVFFGFTYGKWEWNTLRHGSGWHRTVLDESARSGVPFTESISEGGISLLKLFSYGTQETEVFVKDNAGNKWIFHFHRSTDGTWTTQRDQAWDIEMVHSVYGGSAQQVVWWY